MPEKKHSDEEIGAEKPDDRERDDIVESRGRAKYDKDKNTGHCGSQEDGEHGSCGFGIDTLDALPAWNSSVAGKCPELPRGRCNDTARGAERKRNNYRRHDRRSSRILNGLIKNLNEGESSLCMKGSVDVANAKE